MSRELDAGLETAIDEPVVRPFLAVRIEVPDPVLVWTGIGTLAFNDSDGDARSWIGIGTLGSLDTVGEATDGSATGIKVGLAQIPAEHSDEVDAQATRGALFEVYVGTLNEAMQAVVATKRIFRGVVDDYKVMDGGDELSVEITGESRAIDQRRPSIKRFTDEWQQRKHPGDKFFQYVPQMTQVSILWAAASQGNTAQVGGGGGGAGIPLSDRGDIRPF